MAHSWYSKRGREIENARKEVDSAFAGVTDRWDMNDPNTLRWVEAAAKLHALFENAYPGSLGDFARGECEASAVSNCDLLDFLEADPMFFRSGYMKEKVLALLRRRQLSDDEISRLSRAVLGAIADSRPRREIRHYCRMAAVIADAEFRKQLEALEASDDRRVVLKANWALAALDGKFTQIARASNNMAWWRSQGLDILEKAKIPRDD